MLFRDVIGQSHAKSHLTATSAGGRVAHAQLFLGPEGSGNLAMALAYAQFLQCESPTADDACGTCNSCQKSAKYVHPDIHFSFPTIGGKATSNEFLPQWRTALSESPYLGINNWLNRLDAENKQGNITTAECLEIMRKLSLKGYEGRYKILVMWLPEFLGKEGNRLLKLIEEPPDDTVFLLVAEQQDQILNTILSRCQLVKFPPMEDEVIALALYEKMNIPEAQSKQIAWLADGNFNKALELLDHTDANNAVLFLEWMRMCYQGRGADMVQWVEKMAGGAPVNGKRYGRKDQRFFIQYALHYLRELLVIVATGKKEVRLLEEERNAAIKLAQIVGLNHIQSITTLLNNCAYHIERNANPRILFLNASIRLHRILKGKVPSLLVESSR